MRVVFMGTPDFSVGTLRELAKAGHEIAGVISQPDKPKGRERTCSPHRSKKRRWNWDFRYISLKK